MEQLASSLWPFSSFLPSFTDPTTSADMSYNNRQLSPGGRRIANAGRVSESAINDPSYHQRNNSYASPRSSGVIPLSTVTYVSTPQSSIARPASRHDSYSSRPRRSSLVDNNRSSGTTVNQIPSRSRPTIIQTEPSRPSSPGRVGEQRGGTAHKKVYSIDDGAARLVADVNLPVRTVVERNHRRRDSDTERSNRRLSDLPRDRGQKVYHSNGQSRQAQPNIDAEDAFSYTDPAGMYRDTEPRWREVRPRRGSLDRANRERPVSMVDPTADQRRFTREVGPPPSTRGWDRINESLGRTRNTRDAGREVSQSPSRGRGYADSRDAYYGQPGSSTGNRPVAMPYPERYEDYGYEEARSPRRHERGNSFSRPERPDRSVERRGFGIRNDFGSTSHDPYSHGSDENLEQTSRYRDATYAEPQRHNTVPDYSYHESRRQEPDRRDRGDRQREPRDKETRRRDDDRSYDREYDRTRDQEYDVDRERERERARQLEPPSDSDRDRHHRRENDRKDNSPRHSGDNVSSPSLSQAASGGLAGVAAALGASSLLKKVTSDKSEREDRDRDRDRDRPRDKRSDDDRDYDREKERDRQRDRERDRGLGFAYENRAESPRASTAQDRPTTRETGHEPADKPVSMPAPAMDPNEEYRRRMEQIQRELGGSADARSSGDEADRERRRRERDTRSSGGRSFDTDAPSSEATSYDYPPPSASRRTLEVDDRSQITGSSVGSSDSRRRQSILDRPMTNEPAEIIDNTQSEKRENRVRIVDPPTEEEDKKPKGILKKPTEKFPEDANVIREGVAPLKDSTKKGIPPGARWTKIDRRLVNPEALTKQGERFEERLDCVIVLRVLTKEEIQKLADLTREIRDQRHEDDRSDRRSSRRQNRYREDEYSDDSENEFKERTPRMLEAPPSSTGASSETDFVRDSRDRRQDRDRKSDSSYSMSGGAGKRE